MVHLGLNPRSITVARGTAYITSWARTQIDGRPPGPLSAHRGLPRYRAPEFGDLGTVYGSATDVYVLGLLLKEVCAGRALRQFQGRVAIDLVEMASLPQELRRMLDRCVHEDPRERPTARALADAFAASLEAHPAPAGWGRPEPALSPSAAPRRWVVRRRWSCPPTGCCATSRGRDPVPTRSRPGSGSAAGRSRRRSGGGSWS